VTRARRALFVQHANPGAYPPVEHAAAILAGSGWEVRCLGVEVPGVTALRFAPRPGVEVRLRPARPPGWRQKAAYLGFAAWVVAWTVRWRPRWVYASDPLAAPAAWLASVAGRARLAYHEHDSPDPADPAGPAGLVAGLLARGRRAVARRAAFSVLPSEARAEAVAGALRPAGEVLTVWNCPARDEAGPPRGPRTGGDLVLVYQGSIVPPRLPVTVLEALARVPPAVRLRVVGYEPAGHRGYVDHLREVAAQLGLGSRVEWLGPMPRAAVLAECRRADAGLGLSPKAGGDLNQRTLAGASNKTFDYLASGLPVLVADEPAWRALVVDPGYGLAGDPDDPGSLALAFTWLLRHPAEARAMGERGRQRVLAAWNYETAWAPARARLEAPA
jgi:glycosyltransferase involved in cell wall biosynthesis